MTYTPLLKPVAGGTGLASPGANGNVLMSDGTTWTSASGAPAFDRVATDVDVAVTTTLLDVTLTPGVYQIDLLAMIEIVGGSSGNGLIVEQDSTLTLAAGQSLSVSVIQGTAAAEFVAPAGSPVFAFTGLPSTLLRIEGTLEVTVSGRFGVRFGKNGSPTSVTLKAGSGLVVTKLSL
jgi:hypothetical protein